MVLVMARPFRHPVTGIYWYRKRVPDALRSLVGKREEKVSLKTRDPAEAKIAHAKIAADVEERWHRLTAGAQDLTQRQAEAVAGEIYRAMMTEYGDDPNKMPRPPGGILADKVFFRPASFKFSGNISLLEKARTVRNADRIDRWLNARGWILTPDSRSLVIESVGKAVLQAREQLERMKGGDYRPDPNGDRFPILETKPKLSKDKFSLLRTFDDYAHDSKLKPESIKRWRPIMVKVAAEVPDIRNLTRDWCLSWRDRQAARGLEPKTVREVYVASLKAMCEWAVNDGRLKENPALRVKVKVPKGTGKRGYTDAEALKILRASLLPMSARSGPKHRAARRWIPTLCAYTGARVGEVAQLRKQDIRKTEGVWMLRITPEAGTVKTDQERDVPIYPEVIRQGFLDFVTKTTGPLFYTKKSPRGGSDQNPTSKKPAEWIAKWIREDVGITDKNISPSHAWRHRFKTVARRAGMDSGARDYMQGHAPASEGEDYGEFEPATLFKEISKLPVIDIGLKSPRTSRPKPRRTLSTMPLQGA
jgi:integrase